MAFHRLSEDAARAVRRLRPDVWPGAKILEKKSGQSISLRYVDKAISTAPGYGKGFGPLNHLVLLNMRNIDA